MFQNRSSYIFIVVVVVFVNFLKSFYFASHPLFLEQLDRPIIRYLAEYLRYNSTDL